MVSLSKVPSIKWMCGVLFVSSAFIIYLNMSLVKREIRVVKQVQGLDPLISNTTAFSPMLLSTQEQIDADALYCQNLKCKGQDEFSYWIRSGVANVEGPLICFDGKVIVSPKKPQTFSRGVNIVVISVKLRAVMDYRSFDTYDSPENCLDLARYLSFTVPVKNPVLIASYDEMITGFCTNARILLKEFGSMAVEKIKFRDSWVFAGESGLPSGLGVEKWTARENNQTFAAKSEIQGCMTLPMSKSFVPVSVDFGLSLDLCGVSGCSYDEISIFVNTGHQFLVRPAACVAGSYVLSPGVKGGRGFNFIVVDPLTKRSTMVRQFDTYAKESSGIDLFLETLDDSVLLIGIVHDDASNSLTDSTKQLLEEFGAHLVWELKARSVMYFVGRKGMRASRFQEISHSPAPQGWPAPLQKRMCVPAELTNFDDNMRNDKRKAFCNSHQGYGDFCYLHHSYQPLLPAPASVSTKDVFQVPILVVAGFNHLALTYVLRSLLDVPGINSDRVTVVSPSYFSGEYESLVSLFQFHYSTIGETVTYHELLERALSETWMKNNNSDYLVVIEEEVLVAPGFLRYMQSALNAMTTYKSIGAASAWNPNGFVHAAVDKNATYYVDDFVGMAFLLSKKFYDGHMRNHMAECCSQRWWQGWFRGTPLSGFHFLMPEVPRADLYRAESAYLSFRVPSLAMLAKGSRILARSGDLDEHTIPSISDYKAYVQSALQNSVDAKSTISYMCSLHPPSSINQSRTSLCISGEEGGSKVCPAMVVVYHQKDDNDFSALVRLCNCLDLTCVQSLEKPLGLHQGLLRFSLHGTVAFLLGTKSPYYNWLPSHGYQIMSNI